jgi:hypothetical protein
LESLIPYSFSGKYFEYDGEKDVYDKSLTIGGYESAGLVANLVLAAYVLDQTEQLFRETAFNSIYHGDGLMIFNGKRTATKISSWLDKFPSEVNQLTEYEGLQFTVNLWDQEAAGFSTKRVTIEEEE